MSWSCSVSARHYWRPAYNRQSNPRRPWRSSLDTFAFPRMIQAITENSRRRLDLDHPVDHLDTRTMGGMSMSARTRSSLPHGRAPGVLLQLLEVRAFWEHYASIALRPFWSAAPLGDGHPILVLPGLAAGDASTVILRRFLRSRGFSPRGWGQGVNLGLREGVLERAHNTLRELWAEQGRSVSIVGWRLGGPYARELARQSPDMVRLVITLGSPFTGHPRETNAWRLYELASGHRIDWHDFHGPLRTPPQVPTTSIWSGTDGVVSWQCSVETRRDLAENIVVASRHLGLGAHPAALYAIADRLAQPEVEWRPFHRRGWRRFVYGDPGKLTVTRARADSPSPRAAADAHQTTTS